jgi:hypothetical protein
MAFTEEQKVRIRFYLGYPDVYTDFVPKLENAMDSIGDRPATKALVEFVLAKLDKIFGLDGSPDDPTLLDEMVGEKMGISKIKDFETEIEYGNTESAKNGSTSSYIYNDISLYARTWIARLSNILSVEIWSDNMGTKGYKGPLYKAYNGEFSTNWFGL